MWNSKSSLLTRSLSSHTPIVENLAKQTNWGYWMSGLYTAIKAYQVLQVPTWPLAWAEAQEVWMHLRGTHDTDALLNCLLILWWFIMEQRLLSLYVAGTVVCGIPTKRRCEWKGMDVSADNRSRSWVSCSTVSCSFLVLTHTSLLKFGSNLQIATFERGF